MLLFWKLFSHKGNNLFSLDLDYFQCFMVILCLWQISAEWFHTSASDNGIIDLSQGSLETIWLKNLLLLYIHLFIFVIYIAIRFSVFSVLRHIFYRCKLLTQPVTIK